MKADVGLFGDAANFLERLDGTELVVGVHDGNEHRFRAKSAAQILKVNQTVLIHMKISDIHALLFQGLAGV